MPRLSCKKSAIHEAGVWFPEQVVSAERFFEALGTHGYEQTFEELTLEQRRSPFDK